MNLFLVYIFGVITPFLFFAAVGAKWIFIDWLKQRRYQLAWDMFTAEWDGMSEKAKAAFTASKEPWERDYCDERSRWFAKRWNGGNTTEV